MHALFYTISLAIIILATSCNHDRILPRVYRADASADITITTEKGEIIFIPRLALRTSDGQLYSGMVNIRLAGYDELYDSLARRARADSLFHPVQLYSSVIQCIDENGDNLQVNMRDGYSIMLCLPLVARQPASSSNRFIDSARLPVPATGFDSFHLRQMRATFPVDEQQLNQLAGTPTDSLNLKMQELAFIVIEKRKSIQTFHNYISYTWHDATNNFIRSLEKDGPQAIYLGQSDIPSGISFLGFCIKELYQSNAPTHLREIIYANADKWQNSLLLVDWTGSMHSHRKEIDSLTTDLVFSQVVSCLSVYNDKPDPAFADLESTEGIFFLDTIASAGEVQNLMKACEEDFDGNNIEESDLSALIRCANGKVHQWKHDFNRVIMLVDNNAPPRDFKYLDSVKLNKELVVIAYGAGRVEDIKPEYHALVKKFNGLLYAESSQLSFEIVAGETFHRCADPGVHK